LRAVAFATSLLFGLLIGVSRLMLQVHSPLKSPPAVS